MKLILIGLGFIVGATSALLHRILTNQTDFAKTVQAMQTDLLMLAKRAEELAERYEAREPKTDSLTANKSMLPKLSECHPRGSRTGIVHPD